MISVTPLWVSHFSINTCLIGHAFFAFKNTPAISASTATDTTFFYYSCYNLNCSILFVTYCCCHPWKNILLLYSLLLILLIMMHHYGYVITYHLLGIQWQCLNWLCSNLESVSVHLKFLLFSLIIPRLVHSMHIALCYPLLFQWTRMPAIALCSSFISTAIICLYSDFLVAVWIFWQYFGGVKFWWCVLLFIWIFYNLAFLGAT